MQQQEEQRQRQRREPEPDHLFKGVYIGDGPLAEHLEEIDPDSHHFRGVRDYIMAFAFTQEYFSQVYPFYNGSKVSESTIFRIYESSFIAFVQMFKLNHPDWSEYSNDECLDHFIDFIEFNPNPEDYIRQGVDDGESCAFYYHDLNRTPPTHEKPHFDAYEIEYGNNALEYYGENYAGSGYFRDANGEEVPFNRQMGIWGPFGIRRFHLYNRIALVERYRGNDRDLDFLPSIQLRLPNGTPFDISIDTSEEKNHARFIENENDDLFLFEESLQNERRERRLEKLRQLEQDYRQLEQERQHYEQIMQFKNRESQKKIEKKRREMELFDKQITQWANFNALAYTNHPATIEMAQKFSAPIEPFVYRNLPTPVALPHEYRNPVPILDDDE
jgi:hypothetical protein